MPLSSGDLNCPGVSFPLLLEDQFRYRTRFSLSDIGVWRRQVWATCQKGHLKSHLPRKAEFEWGTECERAFVISCVDLQRFLFQLHLRMECALRGRRWDHTKAPCLSPCPHVASPRRHLSRVGACQPKDVGLAPGSVRSMVGKEVRPWVCGCEGCGCKAGMGPSFSLPRSLLPS